MPSAPASRRDFGSRLFGYDVFISFALGPPPRGSLSYASDLARRLRERDLTVFFSEDEAAPGEELDSTLRRALHGSRALVVIANRGTLLEPRWVRKEVESFRGLTPPRPIIPINVGGALLDAEAARAAAVWLPFEDKIWLDETQSAGDSGIASPSVVERLALAPRRVRANVKWRWLVRAIGALLLALAVGMSIAFVKARTSDQRARMELSHAVALRAAVQAPAMVTGDLPGGQERALQLLLSARSINPQSVAVQSAMLPVLDAMSPALKLVDTGAALFAVAHDAAGRRVVTAGSGGRVRQWDAQRLQPVGKALKGPDADIFGVAYSPDGKQIAAAGIGGALWLWHAETGERVTAPAAASSTAIRALAFMPDGRQIVTAGVGGRLQFWDSHTAKPAGAPLQGHGEVITSLAISPNGRRIVSGGDYHLQLWTAQSSSRTGTVGDAAPGVWDSVTMDIGEKPYWVQAVAFAPDGTRIASGGSDGQLRLWDGRTGKLVAPPTAMPSKGVVSLRFSPDGTWLIAGCAGGSVLKLDARTGRVVAEWLSGQTGRVAGVSVSHDGERAISVGEDGMLRLWHSGPATPVTPPAAFAQVPTRGVAVSPDGSIRVEGTDAGALRLVDAATRTPLSDPLRGHQVRASSTNFAMDRRQAVQAIVFSADGRMLASGSQNGSIRLWQAQPLKPLGDVLTAHDSAVSRLAFSPDGRYLASGDEDGMLRFWQMVSDSDGKVFAAPLGSARQAHVGSIARLLFSADGMKLFTQDREHGPIAWPAPAAWPGSLCAKLTRNPSPALWGASMSREVPYREPCPGLAMTPDAP